MKEFQDYSSMLGLIDDWTTEKLKAEIKRYNEKYDEIGEKKRAVESNLRILDRNVRGFERRLKQLQYAEMVGNFKLSKDHLILLENCDIEIISSDNYDFYYICELFGYKRTDLSPNQQIELDKKICKLIDELPLAVKQIAKDYKL